MRYIALVLMLLLSFSLSITLQKATSIAQDELKIQTTPQSVPAIQSKVSGDEFWIVELDSVWVPVKNNGTIVKEYDNESYEAVKLHYVARNIYLASSRQDYITRKTNTFLIMQGNVQAKISFLQTYYPQMPDELKRYVSDMLQAATDLDNSLDSTLSALNSLKAIEGNIMSTQIDGDKYALWSEKFRGALSGINNVVGKAYLYDNKKNAFLEAASNYTLRDDVSPESRQLVKSFMTGVDITGIPSTLPSLNDYVSNWDNWFKTQLSDAAVQVASTNHYEAFIDALSKSDVNKLGLEAYSRINSVTQAYSDVGYSIGDCLDELGVRDKYDDTKGFIDKASEDYQSGKDFYDSGDYSAAMEKFNSSIQWVEKAENNIDSMKGLECGQSNGGIPSYAMVLGVILIIGIGVYYFKMRPKGPGEGEEEGEEYEDYDSYGYY